MFTLNKTDTQDDPLWASKIGFLIESITVSMTIPGHEKDI
jgi:hypothetical protein